MTLRLLTGYDARNDVDLAGEDGGDVDLVSNTFKVRSPCGEPELFIVDSNDPPVQTEVGPARPWRPGSFAGLAADRDATRNKSRSPRPLPGKGVRCFGGRRY